MKKDWRCHDHPHTSGHFSRNESSPKGCSNAHVKKFIKILETLARIYVNKGFTKIL